MSSIKKFLSSSRSRGVTTTHPWCSVFTRFFSYIFSRCRIAILSVFSRLKNCVKMKDTFFSKILARRIAPCFICCIFVFSSTCISVSASQSNIPEMTDWQFAQAIDAYAGLTDDQKDIANFLVGSQGYAFAGIAQSNLQSNFSSYSDTVNYVKDFGAKMWDEFNNHVDGIVQSGRNNDRAVKNDLSNFFGNAVTYAKTRSESFSAWLGNVGIDYNSSTEFRIQFGKDQAQNNVDYFGDQGLYNWQFSRHNFSTNVPYITTSFNSLQLSQYSSAISSVPLPHVRHNSYSGSQTYNNIYGGEFFNNFTNIFVNTSNNTVYLCSDNGSTNYSDYGLNYAVRVYKYSNGSIYVESINNFNINFSVISYSNSIFVNYIDVIRAIYNNNLKFFSSQYFYFEDFIKHCYVGTSWNDKIEVYNDTNLNLSSTSQYVTINAPTEVIYLDLNGFMRDLYDNPTIIYNYVINNSVDGNGDPVDGNNFQPTSKYPGIPDSGITIGTEFFKFNGLNPLFGQNGYIWALWNNTKGLVQYIASIFSMMTFEGGDSPAFVIYGALAIGVVGGIFSKFLL